MSPAEPAYGPSTSREPIAIVGRGCVVPDALDPDTFWENIAAGRCSLSPIEAGGQVRGFDAAFDATGFAVDAGEIMRLDPLFRWVLHAARQALREAGQASGALSGCGLVLGNLSYPSTGLTRLAEQVWRDGQPSAYTDARDRFSSGLPAHFAAGALGLGAGAYALDAACASALYAVKLGCDRLHDGTADLMLAGAVSCPDRLLIRDGFQALQAASPSGRSRPFHRAADGLVAGEGAAVVALMRLGDALRSGTPILGVIRAVGLSNDGRTGGLLSPAESGQVRAMRLAYTQAGVAPESVSLVECHATGTPVGDAVEARSMARVFAGSTDLPIGSVKSNVGHLLAAAGAAGLLKVLGAIRAGVRPPSLSADDPIEALDGTPLRLLPATEHWPGPRRAAVNAFGFGGTNAHLIIDEWTPEGSGVSDLGSEPSGSGALRERRLLPVTAGGGVSGATTRRPGGSVAITALAAKVADGADADAFRRALLLGEPQPVARTSIDVAVSGLRFPPNDLRSAHAQHTLLLETAREATETIQLPGERTMVIVGMGVDPEVARYPVARRAGAGPDTLTGAEVLGTMPNLIANRVNVQLDLSGPSYTVSAEESSGLVALELASRALRAGEVDAAVVGAVDLSCEPVHKAAARALGKDRPAGDAAVVFVLERLSDARRNGRQVIALLDEPVTATSVTELVVGDREPDEGVAHFDPAELFGVPHAAAGLLAAAVAATAIQHRAIPRAGRPAVPVRGDLVARAVVAPLGASSASVRLRSAGAAQPWIAGPAPRLQVYSGADRAAVLEALVSGQQSATGPARLAIVTDTEQDFAARAQAARRWLAQGGPRPDGMAYRDRPLSGEVAFVFTNGSATYPGMGAELALAFPAIADAVGYAPFGLAEASPGGSDVLDQIWGAALLSGLHAQISRGLLGVRPDAAIGYSSGESAAFGALGAWTDIADLHRDLRASDLFRTGLTGEFHAVREVWRGLGRPARGWASYVVSAPLRDVRAALAGEATVHLMAINTPDTCVIGGEETACEAVLGRLGAAPAFPLDYRIAAHAPELATVLEEYRRLHLRPTRDVPGVRFYSGATGESYRASADAAADAIAAQAIDTVDFVRVVERAWADGVRVFVEHGPQAQCTGWIRRILGGRDHLAVPLDASGGRAVRQLCQAAAELVVAGVQVDTSALFSRLAEAAHRAPDRGETLRFAAHPPPPRLPSPPIPSPRPPATAMPRAPRLPPVLVDSALSGSDQPWTQAQPPVPAALAPVAANQPVPVALTPVVTNQPVPVPLARVVADQFERVTALHRDYLARQAEAHTRFLSARQDLLVALTQIAPQWTATAALLPASMPGASLPGSVPAHPVPRGPVFDRAQLEYLAEGRVSVLLGPEFAALDDRRRQTRLPTPPMLLADRVLGIDAVPASMTTGTIWTETDVRLDSWYLDATGRMPAGLMVEAGQADLLLISWLGVDLLGHGDRAYRLLGCELTYHGSPAAAGDTLRYEIQIDGHAEHAGVRLFSFHSDCHVAGDLRMTVRNGQAGFFTDEELASTEGLQWEPGPRPQDSPPPEPVEPVAAIDSHQFDHAALQAFADGRPADCFGPGWMKTRAHLRTPRIPHGRMLLLDTVTNVDFQGGPGRRGYLRAETAVGPDDWFFAGHFKNDPCMPGTLMLEGGLQAMAFHLAALGLTIDRDGWRFEPVPGEPCVLRCRGQVSPASRRIVYEVFVSEITSDPYPTIYADVLGTVDGVKAFHAQRAALRLVPDWPLEHWSQLDASGVTPDGRAVLVGGVRQDYTALLACAWGRLTHAMGPDYAGFEGGRRAPRLPGPPYHFMTRIVEVDGPLGGLRVGSTVTAEYDVPPSAWYFEQNATPTMPFAVIMEVALQPCGWLAMYVGSVLGHEVDLLFRNLDGTGTVMREVPPGTQALSTRVELTDVSRFGNVIVESFTVKSTVVGGPDHGAAVFEAVTTFGFFPHEAFAQQPGLPPSEAERAWLALPVEQSVDLRDRAALAGPMLLMLDRVTGYWPDAGRAGLGRLRAEKDIDPGEWYFKAHFFQDPVQPGSLGLQAMCHLLQWYLIERGLVADLPQPRFEPVITGHTVTWKYRGQVVPTDLRVTVELEVTGLGEDALGRYATADAWLWVDGRRIYQITNLGVRVIPGAGDAASPGAQPTTSWTD